ncbi:MAG: helix-hairpin-helix domain-containing protein [Bacteroidota bacterium]
MAHYKKKKKTFRNSWKDYFSLNHRVRRGLIVLFGLISIEILALVYLHYLPASAEKIDVGKFKKEIDEFYASGIADSTVDSDDVNHAYPGTNEFAAKNFHEKNSEKKVEVFSFNPNHLPDSAWKRLGFSEKQIHSIQNYEAKGGKFRTKEDVRKMYAIRPAEFNRIEPYIAIPETVKAVRSDSSRFHKTFLIVDIGTADSTELEKLPMVGNYLAQKISNYREKLGGFNTIDQLKEIRGMRDSTLLVIMPHVILGDSTNLRRINLNNADYNELNRHPYIDNSVANLIVNYRKQHGSFKVVEDLRKVALVDAELYRKIAPYLKVE